MNFTILLATAIPTTTPGLWSYFTESNSSGQVIVGVLLIMSILAWTVMLAKHLDLKKIATLNQQFERKIQQIRLTETPTLLTSTAYCPYAIVCQEALRSLQLTEAYQDANLNATSFLQSALDRKTAEQVLFYESKMPLLATIISGAPFLGLLGTVWGVMDAFGSVALQASVTLQMLAPGVSGALLTTVAALLVAIPSVFGYNYLLRKIRCLTVQLENFTSLIEDRLKLEKMDALAGSQNF